jgi:hypothetical protein
MEIRVYFFSAIQDYFIIKPRILGQQKQFAVKDGVMEYFGKYSL